MTKYYDMVQYANDRAYVSSQIATINGQVKELSNISSLKTSIDSLIEKVNSLSQVNTNPAVKKSIDSITTSITDMQIDSVVSYTLSEPTSSAD